MDTIWGYVTAIVDGDTFDLNVTAVDEDNEYEYSEQERIRIHAIDAPELPSIAGKRAATGLQKAIDGEYVRCDVRARDTYRRLICDVSMEEE
jgi:endonuclease YncB( thermonuclease family)